MQNTGHSRRSLLKSLGIGAVVIFGVACAAAQATSELRTYPVPPTLLYSAHNDDYTVRVRQPGGPWQDLYEYRVQVDTDTKQNASMVYFDFAGSVEIEVQKNNGLARSVGVSPLSSSVRPILTGTIARLTLTAPERLSLQFDDDRLRNLHIIAGSLPAARPAGNHVRYFGPGVHTPPVGTDIFQVKSGDHVYLDGGAVLKGGAFDLSGLDNVTISGRGLIWDPGRGIDLDRSRNIDIGDLILVNSDRKDAARIMNIRNSSNVKVRDITGFTSGKWSDGINISTSQHVVVDGGYLRVSDDAVVVYAVADCPLCRQRAAQTGVPDAQPPGDTYDIKVRNLRIWNDVAHALYIGHFGDNDVPRTIADVTFDNIDIANLDEDDPDWEGAMAIYSGDSTLIKDIRFHNIRVDRIEEGKLIHVVAGKNTRYNKAAGRGITNIAFRNIRFTGDGMPGTSVIKSLSPATAVRNVTIENIVIKGERVRSLADADLEVGSHVNDLELQ